MALAAGPLAGIASGVLAKPNPVRIINSVGDFGIVSVAALGRLDGERGCQPLVFLGMAIEKRKPATTSEITGGRVRKSAAVTVDFEIAIADAAWVFIAEHKGRGWFRASDVGFHRVLKRGRIEIETLLLRIECSHLPVHGIRAQPLPVGRRNRIARTSINADLA